MGRVLVGAVRLAHSTNGGGRNWADAGTRKLQPIAVFAGPAPT
jgi:hypothetical protein